MPRLVVRKNETNVAIANFLGGSLRANEAAPESSFGWPSLSPHPVHLDPDYRKLGNDSNTSAELWVTHNLYHWLNEATVYDAAADRVWQEWFDNQSGGMWEACDSFPYYYANYLARMEVREERQRRRDGGYSGEEIAEVKLRDYYEEPGGIYGDNSGPVKVYTYNHDNCLEHDIMFLYWEQDRNDDGYVIVSLGGSHTILLRTSVDGNGTIGWFDYNRYGIGCSECQAIWSGDNGAEWNGEGWEENNPLLHNLDEYNAREGDALDAAFLNATTGVLVGDEKPWIVIEQHGQYPTDGTTVYCPHCGKGTLSPWLY